jgi:nucleoid-associated protein YgaU
MDGQYQNAITSLPNLNTFRYERIFKMYSTDQNQYYYNLLQSIFLPDEIDDSKVFYLNVKQNLPWTMISFNAYGNIELWWLIMLTNKIYNPIKNPPVGSVLKLIKPEYIAEILKEISNSLN